ASTGGLLATWLRVSGGARSLDVRRSWRCSSSSHPRRRPCLPRGSSGDLEPRRRPSGGAPAAYGSPAEPRTPWIHHASEGRTSEHPCTLGEPWLRPGPLV